MVVRGSGACRDCPHSKSSREGGGSHATRYSFADMRLRFTQADDCSRPPHSTLYLGAAWRPDLPRRRAKDAKSSFSYARNAEARLWPARVALADEGSKPDATWAHGCATGTTPLNAR